MVYATGLSIPGGYVLKAGDTMTGYLTFSGNQGITTSAGNLNIYATSAGQQITAVSNDVTSITSIGSGINLQATNGIISLYSTGITNQTIGTGNITLNAAAGKIYMTAGGDIANIENNNIYFAGVSGELLSISGSQIKISLGGSTNYIGTNSSNVFYKNILPSGSGTVLIGTSTTPFSGIYTQNVNGVAASYQVYNEIPSGLVNGANLAFTTLYTPVSGTSRLYRAGMRQTPAGVDYTITGNAISFITAPSSGDNILIDYERPVF